MASRRGLRRARIARAAFAIATAVAALASIVAVPGLRGILGGALALLMGAIALYDARYFIIPNALNAVALTLALVHAAALEPGSAAAQVAIALLRAAIAGAMFLALKLGYRRARGREGIGMGDVKLAGVAGAWLDGFAILLAVEIAVLAALGLHLLDHVLTRRTLRATSALPFGLYLAPAIWIAWFLPAVLRWP